MCQTSGSSINAFKVPARLTPKRTEWLTVDQYLTATGRLEIKKTGEVFVEADVDHPGAAATFTSLDGVTYTLPY